MPPTRSSLEQHSKNGEHSPSLVELKSLSLQLRDALRELVSYEPGLRPAEIGRRFGVNKDTSSRVIGCCQIEDGLEFAYRCLSPATLRRVISSARELGSGSAVGAERAVDAFEHHVRTEFGDQSTMNVLIGAVHPELGLKAEAAQKQSIFRGMSQLHGLFAEVSIQLAIMWRSDEPHMFCNASAYGCLGLRRLRPGPPIVMGTWHVDQRTGASELIPGVEVLTEDWGQIPGMPDTPGGMPWVKPRTVAQHGTVQVQISADVLGTRNAVNYGVIQRATNTTSLRLEGSPRHSTGWCGMGQLVMVPAKLLVYDLLVEEGLFENRPPELVIYDTAMRGTAALFDPAREFDRLSLREHVDMLPPGPEGHRSKDAPFMPELVGRTLEQCELGGRRFRGYRLRQVYPVYGSQIAYAFPKE